MQYYGNGKHSFQFSAWNSRPEIPVHQAIAQKTVLLENMWEGFFVLKAVQSTRSLKITKLIKGMGNVKRFNPL